MPAKKTKYVKVTVELILHFDEEMSGLPKGMHDPIEGSCHTLAKFMAKHIKPKPIAWTDGRFRYALFHPRKRAKKG